MKKTLIIIATILLFATLFVSCADDKTVFKSISQSSPKSKYKCKYFIGTKDSKNYVLTNNHGIITFEFEEDSITGNANVKKASKITKINTGSHKAIDGAYLSGSTLYALDNDGTLFMTNGTDVETVSDAKYRLLCEGFLVFYDDEESSNVLYKLNDATETEPISIVEQSGIKGVIPTIISKNYIRTADTLYHVSKGEITPILTSGITGKKINDVINVGEEYYIVFDESTVYNIYEKSNLDTAIESLSDEPTASFAIDETHIAYKTKSDIEILTIKTGETPPYDIEYAYDDGWASNICTSETEIYEFAKIGSNYYGLNGNGGMMFIDLSEDAKQSIQIFSE